MWLTFGRRRAGIDQEEEPQRRGREGLPSAGLEGDETRSPSSPMVVPSRTSKEPPVYSIGVSDPSVPAMGLPAAIQVKL